MTISTNQTQQKYQGDGVTVQWNIPFAFNSKDDLEIYVIGSDGAISRVTEDFSINEVSKVLSYPLQNNGAEPLAVGESLLIRRNTPLLQEINFDAQSDVPKSVLENSYDKAMMIAQELSEQLSRAVLFPIGTTTAQTNAQAYLSAMNTAVTTAQNAASAAQSAASGAAADAQASINSYTDSAVSTEKSERQTADAAKLDITAAASTYLTQTDAAVIYLTQSNAADTYLTQSDAATTYLTLQGAGETYLTQVNAAGTYLPQTTAASTYIAIAQKAVAGGVATLDSNTLIPTNQLPTIDGGNANA